MKQATEPIIIDKIGIRVNLEPDLFTLVANLAQADNKSIHNMLIKIIESYFNKENIKCYTTNI